MCVGVGVCMYTGVMECDADSGVGSMCVCECAGVASDDVVVGGGCVVVNDMDDSDVVICVGVGGS